MINSGELYDTFRSDVVDEELPYLWKDEEVWRYMDAAYRMFVRLNGGIADFSSDATRITLSAGEEFVDLHPSLLRIMSAERVSDNGVVKIINNPELDSLVSDPDYSEIRTLARTNTPGTVKYLLIGTERNKGRVFHIPQVDDELSCVIYRLPLTNIVDGTHDLAEVDEDHHIYLLDWMKHLAYKKQDAETFDKTKSTEAGEAFKAYCEFTKAEWARYKHKTRVVSYGGI
jgi:hypothetical protein